MRWKKRGVVWKPDGSHAWAKTHASIPIPHRLSDEVIRVFVTCLDDKGCGRPGNADVAAEDLTRAVNVLVGS